MITLIVLLAIIGLGVAGWFSARGRARLLYTGRGSLAAMPGYHGWHMALWVIVPAILAWIVWAAISPDLVMSAVMGFPAAENLPASPIDRAAVIADAWNLAGNPDAGVFNPLAAQLAEPIRDARERYAAFGAILVAIMAFCWRCLWLFAGACGFSGAHAGRTVDHAAFAARLVDGDPDDVRHRRLADFRDRPVLQPRFADRLPHRPALEPPAPPSAMISAITSARSRCFGVRSISVRSSPWSWLSRLD